MKKKFEKKNLVCRKKKKKTTNNEKKLTQTFGSKARFASKLFSLTWWLIIFAGFTCFALLWKKELCWDSTNQYNWETKTKEVTTATNPNKNKISDLAFDIASEFGKMCELIFEI